MLALVLFCSASSRKIQQLHFVMMHESNCIHKNLKVTWKKSFLTFLSQFQYLLCNCMCRYFSGRALKLCPYLVSISVCSSGGRRGKEILGCISWSFSAPVDPPVCTGACSVLLERWLETNVCPMPVFFFPTSKLHKAGNL